VRVAGVVDDQVRDDPDAAFVRLVHQFDEIADVAELGQDRGEIGDAIWVALLNARYKRTRIVRLVAVEDAIVYIVDDDRRVREALSMLLSSLDMHAVTFGSAAEYMAYPKPDVPACLVLDMNLPDVNGLDLLRQIRSTVPGCEVILMIAYAAVDSAVEAIKLGAREYLTKPFKEADRFARSIQPSPRIATQSEAGTARRLAATARLTPREREVLPLVVSGLNNRLPPSCGSARSRRRFTVAAS
jgi:FixJ family two-component response regulator